MNLWTTPGYIMYLNHQVSKYVSRHHSKDVFGTELLQIVIWKGVKADQTRTRGQSKLTCCANFHESTTVFTHLTGSASSRVPPLPRPLNRALMIVDERTHSIVGNSFTNYPRLSTSFDPAYFPTEHSSIQFEHTEVTQKSPHATGQKSLCYLASGFVTAGVRILK